MLLLLLSAFGDIVVPPDPTVYWRQVEAVITIRAEE